MKYLKNGIEYDTDSMELIFDGEAIIPFFSTARFLGFSKKSRTIRYRIFRGYVEGREMLLAWVTGPVVSVSVGERAEIKASMERSIDSGELRAVRAAYDLQVEAYRSVFGGDIKRCSMKGTAEKPQRRP